MKIEVTTNDINEGARMNCKDCPVAKAITRALPNFKMVAVRSTYVNLYNEKNIWETIHLPRPAVEFIRNFDGEDGNRDLAVPFSFELDLT